MMSQEQTSNLVERIVYERVVDCIDFDALYALEHLLWAALEHCGVAVTDIEALTSDMIGNALDQLRKDPRRSVTSAFGEAWDLCELEALPHTTANASNKKRARARQGGTS